jgi:hypothetical protein
MLFQLPIEDFDFDLLKGRMIFMPMLKKNPDSFILNIPKD